MTRIGQAIGLVLAGGVLMGASSAAATPLVGMWGGDQAVLTLDIGGGRLETPTGHAVLTGPVRPNAKGRFIAKGVYFNDPPGPTIADKAPDQTAARFEGVVTGAEMSLRLQTRGAPAQRFNLTANRRVKLIRAY